MPQPATHSHRVMSDPRSKQAIAYYREKLHQNPTNPVHHHNLAPLLLAQRNVKSAIHHYRRAFELNPTDINSRNDLATVLWHMGKWEAALAALCQVVALNNNHFEGHVNLSAVYFSKGHYDLAAKHAKKATQIKPRDPLGHRVLGQVLDQTGNSAKALHHRRIAIRRGPAAAGGLYRWNDAHTYKKVAAQLAIGGPEERQDGHAFMDAYRTMCGKRVELANSERTKEILHKCLR